MTFFNCINHNSISDFGEFVEKDSVGAAGCILSKDVVRLILDRDPFEAARAFRMRAHGAEYYSIVKYSSNPVTSNTFLVISLALTMRITPPIFMLPYARSSTRRPAEEMYSSLLILT